MSQDSTPAPGTTPNDDVAPNDAPAEARRELSDEALEAVSGGASILPIPRLPVGTPPIAGPITAPILRLPVEPGTVASPLLIERTDV